MQNRLYLFQRDTRKSVLREPSFGFPLSLAALLGILSLCFPPHSNICTHSANREMAIAPIQGMLRKHVNSLPPLIALRFGILSCFKRATAFHSSHHGGGNWSSEWLCFLVGPISLPGGHGETEMDFPRDTLEFQANDNFGQVWIP